MFSFIKSLFSKQKPDTSPQIAIAEENAVVAQYRQRGIAAQKGASFDITSDECDQLQPPPVDESSHSDGDLVEAIVSAMFDRRNDSLSEVPEGNYDFIAVDVETANRDPSTICQIGLAFAIEGSVETFVTLIDPETPVDGRNYSVHMIDDDDLEGMPTFPVVMSAIRSLLERHTLIQHSTFDRKAIDGACDRYGLTRLSTTWGDSINAAKHAWPDIKSKGGYGLRNVANILSIEFSHHDAGEDAKACALTVLAAMEATGLPLRQVVTTAPHRKATIFPAPIRREPNPQGSLSGSCAVFTGSLSISRSDAADLASQAGIRVVTSVSRKVTLLVVGDQDLTLLAGHEKSSKHRKADELIADGHPIRIIGEAEFLELICP